MHLPVNLLVPILVAAALAVVVIALAVALRPSARIRRQLVLQARVDFESARGAMHLKLMREARNRLEADERREREALSAAAQRRARLNSRRDGELRDALEKHLLQTRLREIPGIGESLAFSLQFHAERQGGLKSLRHVEGSVSGIGPARQIAIDAWLDRIDEQMPELLAGEFPGKQAIIKRSATEAAELEAEIQRRSASVAAIGQKLERLRQEIKPLEQVTFATFRKAVEGEETSGEGVERYLRGAFAEWEPVPDWFREVVGGVAD